MSKGKDRLMMDGLDWDMYIQEYFRYSIEDLFVCNAIEICRR